MPHEIVSVVDKNGNANVEVKGWMGPDCTTKSRPFVDALGNAVADQPTPEMYESPVTTHQEEKQ